VKITLLKLFCVIVKFTWRSCNSENHMTSSGGASSVSRGRVESCARRISWDSVGFRVYWCCFMLVSFNLRLPLLVIVDVLVWWYFEDWARWLLICLLQQALLRQVLPGSGDGGAMTAACLRLTLVSIIVAWFKYLFIIFITFQTTSTAIDYY
jgi:hypothetical protein